MFGNNRRLREELSELKEKLQRQQAHTNALDRSNSRIEFRPDGSIVNANDNFLRTMGYTLAEISGQHHRIFCDSKLTGSPEYEKFWQRLRQGEYVAGRFKRLRKDAQAVWLEASYNPILDSNGQVLGIVKLATDITQEVLQEQDQKARLAAIDRAMAVIEFDLAGNILTANDNFLTTMGYRAADIKGRQHRMFCDAELANSPDYARFWQRLSAGEVISGRFKRLRANGSIAWLEANYNPVLDADGKPVMRPRLDEDGKPMVASVQRYSDTLAIFLLKAHAPDKYRERTSVDLKAQVNINDMSEADMVAELASLGVAIPEAPHSEASGPQSASEDEAYGLV